MTKLHFSDDIETNWHLLHTTNKYGSTETIFALCSHDSLRQVSWIITPIKWSSIQILLETNKIRWEWTGYSSKRSNGEPQPRCHIDIDQEPELNGDKDDYDHYIDTIKSKCIITDDWDQQEEKWKIFVILFQNMKIKSAPSCWIQIAYLISRINNTPVEVQEHSRSVSALFGQISELTTTCSGEQILR